MSPLRLGQVLRRAAQLRPQGTATVCGERRRSWEQVQQRVARAAAALQRLGVGAGERVALLGLNSDHYLEAYFAIPEAGGVVVPLNTRLASADLQFMLADSGAAILCVDAAFAHLLPALQGSGSAVRHVIHLDAPPAAAGGDRLGWEQLAATPLDRPAGAPPPERHGDDLAALCYTGGSTGRSKGVMLSHANLVTNALNACWMIGYDASSVYLHASPMFHLTDGMSTLAVTLAGGTHAFVPKFEAEAVLQAIEQVQATHLTLVPTMIAMLLEVPGIERMRLGSLRQLMFGAAPISEATLRQAVRIWPEMAFLHGWGMTELSPLGTLLPHHMRRPAVAGERLGSVGLAMPNLELRIVGEDGREVPRGTAGEIVVRGPTVMLGYWNRPQETEAALRGGWLHTGDAAVMDEEGYVRIVDRLKDMIISGGENIYSTEVENAVSLMPGVAQVAVIGIPSEKWGETVHAVVVPQAGCELSGEAVVAWARARLAPYKVPRSVAIRAERLPESGAGKILKTVLREPFWQGRASPL